VPHGIRSPKRVENESFMYLESQARISGSPQSGVTALTMSASPLYPCRRAYALSSHGQIELAMEEIHPGGGRKPKLGGGGGAGGRRGGGGMQKPRRRRKN
jgi:hypothetical protein